MFVTDVANEQIKTIDQQLAKRQTDENQKVELSDSLIEKYNLDIFNGDNAKVGVADDATQLFYDNAKLDAQLTQSQTADLFDQSTSYHQAIETTYSNSTQFWIILIIFCFIISKLILKIRKRGSYASKNRTKVQKPKLYY